MHSHPLPPFDPWLWWQACQQTWMASLDPGGMGRQLRQVRLDRLLHHARRDSPLYASRAAQARVLADFEPIGRRELMLHFDTWCTDRRITRQGAEKTVAAPAAWSDAWLGRYLLWTSSGTLGEPGIFVQDAASLAAFDAIDALRLRGTALAQPGLGLWGVGRRFAFVGALGGPYAGHVSLQRLRRLAPPPWGPQVHLISVLEPLQQIAEQLQRLQPHVLITYPSCAGALATWQAEGALGLRLDELWLGGEQLSTAQRTLLRQAYRCTLRNNYGASEFYSMACECSQGRLHLNDDWVILEGIDARGRAVAPDEFSCTTLLTNLANHVQPLLRYELTDRIRFVPEPCPCGCALPVIEVQGRSDDVLTLAAAGGGTVQLLPLAVEAAIEEAAGVTHFQLLRRAEGGLELRLRADDGDPRSAFMRCQRALQALLSLQGALPLEIVQGDAEPMQQRNSGKLRRVIDLAPKS
ncbi:MAG TPA: phenylacetate--CoA ligase family protein [Rubrivivax sp.]|nr:phenylacetate--CoA ligase family protein [Rubrivivax sp.]